MSEIKVVPDGTVFLKEGKNNSTAYVILNGKVAVTRHSPQTGDILLAELSKDDVFGEMSLIDNTQCSATVTAVGEVEVQVLTKDNFISSLQKDEDAMASIMGSLFHRIRTMNMQVLNLEKQLSTSDASTSNNLLLKGVTEPAKHALYDMKALVIDDFPYRIGRWSKKQTKRSWFSKKTPNHVSIRDIPPYLTSREHCAIEKRAGSVVVTDLDSRLGTWVNGKRLKGSKEKLQLGSNIIHIGAKQSQFAFEVIVPK